MQQPEQITPQNFSLNPILAKQFIVKTLRVFLSENPKENEHNLEKLVNTLFSVQSVDVRVTFADLISYLKHFPLDLIEPQLKAQLLKNLSQFSENDIVVLCESFTDFIKCMNEISAEKTNLSPMALLFALQFPAEYKNILPQIKKLFENKNKDVSLEIMRILSSFLPRTLKLIFNSNAKISVTSKGHKKDTLPFCEFIAKLANGKRWILTPEKLTRIFTQPICLNLLSNNIVTYDELQHLSIPIIANLNYLYEIGIEVNRKFFELFISRQWRADSHKLIKNSLTLALSPIYNFQLTTDSCYLFILITFSHQSVLQQQVKDDVSFTMKLINIFGVDMLLKISQQIVKNLSYGSEQTLLDLLIYQIKRISSATDDFLNEIKQLLEKFITEKTITIIEFQESIEKKMNEHPEIIAKKNKPAVEPTYIPLPNTMVRMAQAQPIAQATTPRFKPIPQLASMSAKPAAPSNDADLTEMLKRQKLTKLRTLLSNSPNSSLMDLRNIRLNDDQLDSLLEEINQLVEFLLMRRYAPSNQPVVQIAKPIARPTPAAALANLGLHNKRRHDEDKFDEEKSSEKSLSDRNNHYEYKEDSSTDNDQDTTVRENNTFTKHRKGE